METSSIARCWSRRRPPFRLWFKLANLPKVSIRDLAHAGNRTPVAEFASHIDSHYTTDPLNSPFIVFKWGIET